MRRSPRTSIGENRDRKKGVPQSDLGLPYKFGGDAPDHVRLMRAREQRSDPRPRSAARPDHHRLCRRADARHLAADHRARAEPRKWVIEAEYIDGDTADHNGAVFDQLRKETIDREFPDAFGGLRRIDALGVDSGYRIHIVYAWVRKHQRVHPISGHDVLLATKGLKGWGRPAIGQPKLMDINLGGKVMREGVKVWGLGTWPLKSEHYTNLHLARRRMR
jgi:phage terminase large subunit GpA-like protein